MYLPSPRRPLPKDSRPVLNTPPCSFAQPARLEWTDREFLEVRAAVKKAHTAIARTADVTVSAGHSTVQDSLYRAWSDCEALVDFHTRDEADTVRDLFLRAELLTLHYGSGQLEDLLESDCPGLRMLGDLLRACWKIGGAANV